MRIRKSVINKKTGEVLCSNIRNKRLAVKLRDLFRKSEMSDDIVLAVDVPLFGHKMYWKTDKTDKYVIRYIKYNI